jgi:predicted acylesterase/phospholipase RssA
MNEPGKSSGSEIAVHLVLSAGGIKCISYAGAIAALAENGISFRTVSGASAGSLIGAILCSKVGLDGFERAINELDLSTIGEGASWLGFLDLLRPPFAKYRTSRVAETYCRIVSNDPTFEELDRPFATFGVDMRTHKIHLYSRAATPKMKVSEALRISTAAPFLFPPQEQKEALLLDGAVVSQSPVWLATAYEDELPILVIRPKKAMVSQSAQGVLDYIANVIDLAGGSRDYYLIDQIPRARLVEIDCGAVTWDQFTVTKEIKKSLIASGRASIETRLKDLKELLRSTNSPAHHASPQHQEDASVRGGDEAMKKLIGALPPKRDQVFISYSHRDKEWLQKFQDALKPYTWNRAINLWDDTQIPPGANWGDEIRKALASAKVAVLLVSMRFLASDFIRDVEVQEFLRNSKEYGLKILPVALGACAYEETPLKDFQFVNQLDRPLTALQASEQDAELVKICREINKALNS